MFSMRNFFLWFILFLVLIASYDLFSEEGKGNAQEVAFSEFLQDVEAGKVAKVVIRGPYVEGNYDSGDSFRTYNPEYPGLVDHLQKHNVVISAQPVDSTMKNVFWGIFSWFPFLLLIAVWIFFMRQMQSGGKGGGALGFGRSRAKLMQNKDNDKKITFDDVAGIEEAKEDLHEIVDFLKAPNKFRALGGKIPRGCLLVGSPGTGKTLLGRAIAGEAGVPFYFISGSDFVEMFVGVGASRVRDLFEQAKKSAPCLVFIDEIDAVGRHRGAGVGGGNDEREQTLNQLLVEMDGFEDSGGVIVIAATNRPDVLDPALLRPGRFDRQIVVPLPDILGREKILTVHSKNVPLAPDVDLKVIARGTPGFSGADLANLINEASLLAARANKKVVTMLSLEEAKDKILMGAERKSMVIGDEEKRLTAYHEAGHAIVAYHCKNSDPIHKATIIPRGRALGLVMRLPEKDQLSLTRAKAKDDMAVAMGGRVAEEMIFGYEKVTSGASQDIKMATSTARRMVTEWGMSDKVGPLFHSSDQQEVFLGHSVTQQKNLSEETANLIDSEIKSLVDAAYKRAVTILKKHKDQLEKLAKALLEFETLTGEDIDDLLKGKPVNKDKDHNKKPRKPYKTVSVPASGAVVEGSAEKKPKKVTKPKTKPAAEGV